MKNVFLILLTFSLLIFGFYSCRNEENQKELQLSETTFDQFVFKLLDDFSVPLTNKKSGNNLNQIILSNETLVNEFVQGDESIVSLKYRMTLSHDSLSFHDFKVVRQSDIVQTKVGRPVSVFDNIAWDCPDGQSLVKRCYSQDCVENTLTKQATNFSSGETITVHHGGVAGVKICSDVK